MLRTTYVPAILRSVPLPGAYCMGGTMANNVCVHQGRLQRPTTGSPTQAHRHPRGRREPGLEVRSNLDAMVGASRRQRARSSAEGRLTGALSSHCQADE